MKRENGLPQIIANDTWQVLFSISEHDRVLIVTPTHLTWNLLQAPALSESQDTEEKNSNDLYVVLRSKTFNFRIFKR